MYCSFHDRCRVNKVSKMSTIEENCGLTADRYFRCPLTVGCDQVVLDRTGRSEWKSAKTAWRTICDVTWLNDEVRSTHVLAATPGDNRGMTSHPPDVNHARRQQIRSRSATVGCCSCSTCFHGNSATGSHHLRIASCALRQYPHDIYKSSFTSKW